MFKRIIWMGTGMAVGAGGAFWAKRKVEATVEQYLPEQVAVRARDAGFEVIYQGIRLTPEQIVAAAVAEDVHCVGLSILSGSHMELVPDVLDLMRAQGLEDVPVIVGGIIPDSDGKRLIELGVAAVFTPKDFSLTDAMAGIVAAIRKAHGLAV